MSRMTIIFLAAAACVLSAQGALSYADPAQDEAVVSAASAVPQQTAAAANPGVDAQNQALGAQNQAPTQTPAPAASAAPIPDYRTFQAVRNMGPAGAYFDPMKFTLGPDDAVEIDVMRHPEFSGVFPINQEGKLQYKFVGDIDVVGLTKRQLEEKIASILSKYIVAPEVSVTVTEYRSKVYYVLGEVTAPGKYYMRSENISIREAIFEAGLPTARAATRKVQIISPKLKGKPTIRYVNLYSILYRGHLKNNVLLKPGDILYVPSTVMAKIIKTISPPAEMVGVAASGPSSASEGRTASETLRGRPY